MLDSDTKRRIDTARDILVGKVPDPKSQVEQITIALIYKFMDDMDAGSEELGGERKFFAGEFAKYGWAKLMRPGVGGHEMLGLYADAITRMPENPGIPPLFRNIFNNAYLPYRDPETLRAFLKVIDEFEYDHSERLGDAFEYLLSVLGSQGDAGQFRTPRHIIEFMVDIVDPKKNEKVLDPACGTGGFLISAWKHILDANKDTQGESTLTPDERAALANNFTGYDISPDMVRLSLVNMYLHGFANPEIVEYDTLTSDEKWNEHADVILANPPFMSPKGGIRPHKRFGVQSKRSEVLFVDYMAEHLTPNGRAAIIVPEGIIFQSQSAYVQLRKMLVEDYLVAVVSLPAGVFNPYSGVKTSILFLDKALAKRSDTIGFFKVENDGFSLGAQRRETAVNDLPVIRDRICIYLAELRDSQSHHVQDDLKELIIPKTQIAASSDHTLTGERYGHSSLVSSRFPSVPLAELASIIRGITFSKADHLEFPSQDSLLVATTKASQESGVVYEHLYNVRKELLKDEDKILRPGDILISTANSLSLLGRTTYVDEIKGQVAFGAFMSVVRPGQEVLGQYLLRYLRSQPARDYFLQHANTTTNISNLTHADLGKLGIPLPPLDVQKGIVAEVDGYQKVIDGARAVVENYRPHIAIDPEWPVVELGTVLTGKPKNGYSGKPVPFATDTKVLSLSATTRGRFDLSKYKYLDESIPVDAECRCKKGDIYLQRGNTAELVGTAALLEVDVDDYVYPDLMIRIRADESLILPKFLLLILQSPHVREFIRANAAGSAGSMPKINQSVVVSIPLVLPPLSEQRSLMAEIEAEQVLVEANVDLIQRLNTKIEATLAQVWEQ